VTAWRKTHRWHPNHLRHAFATRVRKYHGLEAAQVVLGHARADVTQVYAERNEELAAMVVAKIGESEAGGWKSELAGLHLKGSAIGLAVEPARSVQTGAASASADPLARPGREG
jgi:hypothetical protein